MFWIISVAAILTVGLIIAVPLLRARGRGPEPAAAYDLRVYRDQLREVERDLERGVIGPEDAERLRTEIGRKVLDADRRRGGGAATTAGKGQGMMGLAVMALLLAAAVGLYFVRGVPGFEDLPLKQRIADAESAYESRPTQAEAESRAQHRPPAEPVPDDFRALIDRLRAAVAQNPDDPRGLALLATNEMRLGNAAAARDAQQRLVALQGDAATADDLIRLSALMTEAAGGIITPEGEAVLARGLQTDPGNAQGRYMLGLLQMQNGRPDRAFPIWRQLLEEGPADAPWMGPIGSSIRDLAWFAGQPDYVPPTPARAPAAGPMAGQPPAAGQLPGPDADAVAAAGDMTPEERQKMIEGMVGQLESRLANGGGTPEEWARLISSLAVMGNTDHAREIWTEAQARYADKPDALGTVRQAAQEAGIDG